MFKKETLKWDIYCQCVTTAPLCVWLASLHVWEWEPRLTAELVHDLPSAHGCQHGFHGENGQLPMTLTVNRKTTDSIKAPRTCRKVTLRMIGWHSLKTERHKNPTGDKMSKIVTAVKKSNKGVDLWWIHKKANFILDFQTELMRFERNACRHLVDIIKNACLLKITIC